MDLVGVVEPSRRRSGEAGDHLDYKVSTSDRQIFGVGSEGM
jgi:hypothetical protein